MGRPNGGASGVVRTLLLAAALTACYEEPTATCTIHCTPSDPNSCPGDLQCNAAGLCNTDGASCSVSVAWASIGLGARHACGRSLAGDIYCWGDNSVGQLGTGMTSDEPIAAPTKVAGGPYKALTVGAEHACALDGAGAAFCWGQNAYGQSHSAGPVPTLTPVMVLGSPPPFDQITAGASHTCALAGGQLFCWGDKVLTDNVQVSAPTAVGTLNDWTAIAAGYNHVCGISTTNGVMCFGYNNRGQVGDNSNTTRNVPTPVQGLPTGMEPIAVAAGDEISCAIVATPGTMQGQLWCWGHDQDGVVIIDSTNADKYVATQVGTDADWTFIALGDQIACGVRGGTSRCWGNAYDGAIGNGKWDNAHLTVSQAITLGPTDQIVLNTGARNGDSVEISCLRRGPQVTCSGDNAYGQLAMGTYTRKPTPIEIKAPTGHTWKKIDAGHHHNCATIDDDSLLCWGATMYGAANAGNALGTNAACQDGEICDRPVPGTLPAPLTRADTITAGDNFSCALDGTTIHCWGANYRGYLGGNNTTGYSTPVAPAGSTWLTLAGGDTATCGQTAAGDFACWGYVSATQTSAPATTGLQNVTGIMFGDEFGCATTTSNQRVCWGSNIYGQLGSGDLNLYDTVGTAYTGSNVVQVAADTYHACGVTTAGGIQCWGSNNDLESGAPTQNVNQPTPVDVRGTNNQPISGCTRVSVGDTFSCAVCDGRVLCWGENYSAELGRGIASGESTEIADVVKLPTTEMFADVTLGHRHGCALSTSGKIFCWGDSLHGQIGDGSQSRNLPTPIAP